MNTEAHGWILIKLRFGLAGERFPRESQSYMTDLRRIGLGVAGFPKDGRLQGYAIKRARDFLSYVLDLVMAVST